MTLVKIIVKTIRYKAIIATKPKAAAIRTLHIGPTFAAPEPVKRLKEAVVDVVLLPDPPPAIVGCAESVIVELPITTTLLPTAVALCPPIVVPGPPATSVIELPTTIPAGSWLITTSVCPGTAIVVAGNGAAPGGALAAGGAPLGLLLAAGATVAEGCPLVV